MTTIDQAPDYNAQVLDLLNQAQAKSHQKNFFEAEQLCLEAMALAAEHIGGETSWVYGLCLEDLGAVRISEGKLDKADVTLRTALYVLERALGADHEDTMRVFGRLHELYNM